MRRLLSSRHLFVGIAWLAGLPACSNGPSGAPSSSGGQAGSAAQGGSAGATQSGGAGATQGGGAGSGQGGSAGGCTPSPLPGSTVLIDDMETTDHGPIQFTTGITAPLSPGYWYNSGANYAPSGGSGGVGGNAVIDTSDPPQGSFKFTALSKATATLDCKKASEHAAHQSCVLHGLYDTCGVGFEFA